MTRSGIPTEYRSQRFRSRLEARWAAFFDLVGWRWTYEPFDSDGWIPDFLIHGDAPFLVEVGPCVAEADFRSKGEKAALAFPRDVLTCNREWEHAGPCDHDSFGLRRAWSIIVLGVSPTVLLGHGAMELADAGILLDDGYGVDQWRPSWVLCQECRGVGLYAHRGPIRPCGHVPPAGSFFDMALFTPWFDDPWRRAGNETQWRR